VCLVCVYVYAAPLFVADDQPVSPKPEEEALMVCVCLFSLCVCLCCATLRG